MKMLKTNPHLASNTHNNFRIGISTRTISRTYRISVFFSWDQIMWFSSILVEFFSGISILIARSQVLTKIKFIGPTF